MRLQTNKIIVTQDKYMHPQTKAWNKLNNMVLSRTIVVTNFNIEKIIETEVYHFPKTIHFKGCYCFTPLFPLVPCIHNKIEHPCQLIHQLFQNFINSMSISSKYPLDVVKTKLVNHRFWE